MNAYKVQITISVMAKKLSKFKMCCRLQNKNSNKSETVRKLKHSISEISVITSPRMIYVDFLDFVEQNI